MSNATDIPRAVDPARDQLITPTASARRELPPERYQISRGVVIDQVAYHVACHNALRRAGDAAKNNKQQLKLLGEAEDELMRAERVIEELEALASDEDVDYVLAYLKRYNQWEPRDVRPNKMTRTPRLVRAGHTPGKGPKAKKEVPPQQVAFVREEAKRDATNATIITNKSIGPKLRKKLNAHQAGDVLPDGTMVADPHNALLELHDQVNKVPTANEVQPSVEPGAVTGHTGMGSITVVEHGKTVDELLRPTTKWVPPNGAAATSLSELAKPFGFDRRAREVVKKRFVSLYGKLSKMDAEERAAFLAFLNAKFQ